MRHMVLRCVLDFYRYKLGLTFASKKKKLPSGDIVVVVYRSYTIIIGLFETEEDRTRGGGEKNILYPRVSQRHLHLQPHCFPPSLKVTKHERLRFIL